MLMGQLSPRLQRLYEGIHRPHSTKPVATSVLPQSVPAFLKPINNHYQCHQSTYLNHIL